MIMLNDTFNDTFNDTMHKLYDANKILTVSFIMQNYFQSS